MRTVRLAGTPLETSRLGFGTASLHHLLSSSARQRLLEHARAQGIRYFDTAPLYGHETAERELGRFARTDRTDLVLATKSGIVPDAYMCRFPPLIYARMAARQAIRRIGIAGRLSSHSDRDYTIDYTRRRVERSLRLLATDYIDILYLHEPSLALIPDPDGLAMELERLKASGKIRQIGISGFVQDAVDIATRTPALAEVLQLEANASSADWGSLRQMGRAPHATFGHFRDSETPGSANEAPQQWLLKRLKDARRINPDGVIVFSSRREAHIDQTVKAVMLVESES